MHREAAGQTIRYLDCFEHIRLHRRNAQIGEDHVRAGDALSRERLRQPGEIGAPDQQRLRRKTGRSQPAFGLGQFKRVRIETEQSSARLDGAQEFKRMTAIAQRDIDYRFARSWGQNFDYFP